MDTSNNPEFESHLAKLRRRQLLVRLVTLFVLFVAFILALVTLIHGRGHLDISKASLSLTLVALLWESAELCAKLIRKKLEYGLTAWGNLVMEFLMFVGLLVCGTLWCITFLGSVGYNQYHRILVGLAMCDTIVELIAAILLFTLWVWACVDIDRARRVRHLKFIAGNQQRRHSADHDPVENLPPPPPGMAYLVPLPGRAGQPPIYMVPKSSSMYQNAIQPQELSQNGDPVELMGSPKTRELDGNAVVKEVDAENHNARNRGDNVDQSDNEGSPLSQVATTHIGFSPV